MASPSFGPLMIPALRRPVFSSALGMVFVAPSRLMADILAAHLIADRRSLFSLSFFLGRGGRTEHPLFEFFQDSHSS